jgi:hypothetical protein
MKPSCNTKQNVEIKTCIWQIRLCLTDHILLMYNIVSRLLFWVITGFNPIVCSCEERLHHLAINARLASQGSSLWHLTVWISPLVITEPAQRKESSNNKTSRVGSPSPQDKYNYGLLLGPHLIEWNTYALNDLGVGRCFNLITWKWKFAQYVKRDHIFLIDWWCNLQSSSVNVESTSTVHKGTILCTCST